ncbi:MAG: hypothetical protein AB1585_15015 [Thermodesulfobacteriota bacterium]
MRLGKTLAQIYEAKRDGEINGFAGNPAFIGLAATLGIDFDPQKDYDERREIYRISGKIVDTFSTTCVTRGNGMWTTVIAASVLFL